jgi:hypothetical protein
MNINNKAHKHMNIFIKFKALAQNTFTKKSRLLQIGNSQVFTAKDRQEIETKVDLYIDNKMYDIVFKYLDSGYKMTNSQFLSFKENIKSLEFSEKFKTLNHYARIANISNDVLIENFDSMAVYINSSNHDKEPIIKLYKERLKKEEFRAPLVEKWLNYLTEASRDSKAVDYDILYEKIKRPMQQYGKLIFKDVTFNEMVYILDISNKALNNYKDSGYSARHACVKEIIELLQGFMKNTCADDIEQDLKCVRLMYSQSNNNIDKLVEKVNHKVSIQNNLEQLPKQAKDILDNIKQDYLFLEKSSQDLSEEEIFTLNNLWGKRIPEIVGKYLRADPEFRTSMKNLQGQTIEDLMLDSLNNVHEILEGIKKNHTQQLLLDSSSLNRYTRALK